MRFCEFSKRVNLILATDHGSRAGNAFFLSIFDRHPEVLSCPWMLYTYSYIVTRYGEKQTLPAKDVHAYVTKSSYFRFLYNDLDEALAHQLSRFGGDPSAPLDRNKIRQTFDEICLEKTEITRKDLIVLLWYSYVQGIGRDPEPIRYLLLSDAVSLRFENVVEYFSGKTIDEAFKDFPNGTLASLCRDPRAQFASCRHQFINQNHNDYGLRFSTVFQRFFEILVIHLVPDNFASIYWIMYGRQTFLTIDRIRKKYASQTIVIFNEKLNLNFVPTMKSLCDFWNIKMDPHWLESEFTPTMVEVPWRGTGAYNNRYQYNHLGPLQNDSDEKASKSVSPNRYVTERWKTKLKFKEIELINYFVAPEIQEFYPDSYHAEICCKLGAIYRCLFLFSGELPRISWLWKGFQKSLMEGLQRVFFYLLFPLFYILTRIALIRILLRISNQDL